MSVEPPSFNIQDEGEGLPFKSAEPEGDEEAAHSSSHTSVVVGTEPEPPEPPAQPLEPPAHYVSGVGLCLVN